MYKTHFIFASNLVAFLNALCYDLSCKYMLLCFLSCYVVTFQYYDIH